MRLYWRVVQTAALVGACPAGVVSPTLDDAANWRRQRLLIGSTPNRDSEMRPCLRGCSPVRRAWPVVSINSHCGIQFDRDLSAASVSRTYRSDPVGAGVTRD